MATTTLVGTYLVMVLGAYTSAIGAGLSCPDWPTCYGTFVPFFHPETVADSPYTVWQVFVEWFHRGLAMVVGVLILATTVTAWRHRRDDPVVVWPVTVALILLPVQVVLGGLTVTRNLQPVVVTAHLGVASLILVGLTASAVAAWVR